MAAREWRNQYALCRHLHRGGSSDVLSFSDYNVEINPEIQSRQYGETKQIRRILLQASDAAPNRFLKKICFVATKLKPGFNQKFLRLFASKTR